MPGLLDELEKRSKAPAEETENKTPNEEKPAETPAEEKPNDSEKPEETKPEGETNDSKEEKAEPNDTELVIAFGREQYPEEYGEGDFDDTRVSALRKRILEDFKKLKADMDTMTKNNKELFKFVDDNPEFGEFLDKVKSGVSPELALLDIYGEEFLAAKEGSDERNAYMEAKNKRKADSEEVNKNLAASKEALPKILEELGFPQDRIADFEEFEKNFWENSAKGNFDKSYVSAMISAMDHDKNVETAREQGRAEGRNEQIKEKLEKEAGDGLPSSENGGGRSSEPAEKKDEDEATKTFREMATRRKSIFD